MQIDDIDNQEIVWKENDTIRKKANSVIGFWDTFREEYLSRRQVLNQKVTSGRKDE